MNCSGWGWFRGVLERASARETAVRVAAGALAKQLLAAFGITAFGYVVELGGERIEPVDRREVWSGQQPFGDRRRIVPSTSVGQDQGAGAEEA